MCKAWLVLTTSNSNSWIMFISHVLSSQNLSNYRSRTMTYLVFFPWSLNNNKGEDKKFKSTSQRVKSLKTKSVTLSYLIFRRDIQRTWTYQNRMCHETFQKIWIIGTVLRVVEQLTPKNELKKYKTFCLKFPKIEQTQNWIIPTQVTSRRKASIKIAFIK